MAGVNSSSCCGVIDLLDKVVFEDRTVEQSATESSTPDCGACHLNHGTSPRMLIRQDSAWMCSPPRRLNFASPDGIVGTVQPSTFMSKEDALVDADCYEWFPHQEGSEAGMDTKDPQADAHHYGHGVCPGAVPSSVGDPVLSEADLLSPLQVALSADMSSHDESVQSQEAPQAASPESTQTLQRPPTFSADEHEHSFASWDESQLHQPDEGKHEPGSALLVPPCQCAGFALPVACQERCARNLLRYLLVVVKLVLLVQGLASTFQLVSRWIVPDLTDSPTWSWPEEPTVVAVNRTPGQSLSDSESAEPNKMTGPLLSDIDDAELSKARSELRVQRVETQLEEQHLSQTDQQLALQEDLEIVEESTDAVSAQDPAVLFIQEHCAAIASGVAAFAFRRAF